jgi:hypothetical protein
MAITISEGYLSRRFSLGKSASRELVYDIAGTDDENAVSILLAETAPTVYNGLLLEDLAAETFGNGVWKGYAQYARRENNNQFTFTTGGGTQKVTQSLATVGRYARDGETAPDFQGAIGVSEDKVEGCEVHASSYEFTETHLFDDALITYEYRRIVRALTGRWNDATFRDCDPGECLLLAVDGGKRGDERWELVFRFAVSDNVEDMALGGDLIGDTGYEFYGEISPGVELVIPETILIAPAITGIAKLGWDYLWVRYGDYFDAAGNALVKRPISVHVERVSLPGDFSLLGIGTL